MLTLGLKKCSKYGNGVDRTLISMEICWIWWLNRSHSQYIRVEFSHPIIYLNYNRF